MTKAINNRRMGTSAQRLTELYDRKIKASVQKLTELCYKKIEPSSERLIKLHNREIRAASQRVDKLLQEVDRKNVLPSGDTCLVLITASHKIMGKLLSQEAFKKTFKE